MLAGHEFGMLLRNAYLSFHRRANARMLKLGITADQFVALSVLSREEGITQITLVERTASDPNTVTAILSLLERRGLVRREAHSQDRRARCVFLTLEGRRIQRRAAKVAEPLLNALCGCVEKTAREQVELSLRQIHAVFSSSPTSTNGRSRRRAESTKGRKA